VNLGQFPQPLRGLFLREVALGFGEHLVADHEFFDGGRAQERGVEVGVELPVIVILLAEGRAVPAHGVGEGGLEEVVVAGEEALEDVGEGIAFLGLEIGQVAQ